ncbi:hypothetical protein F4Z99_16555 [Candidatus Poribacteria bacterium]|nr:hypothetical protein [Candidatus Poribacteria bacterium]MYB01301.1 hypothetical protein [Candidatus Poribacteria bacterium]
MKVVATKQELPHGIDSPAVPPGYKQTDFGVIPEHWHIKQLADICMPHGIIRGPFGGTLKKDTFVTSGFKVYEQQNAIYKSSELGSYFVNQSKYAEMHRFSVSPGDFIISCSGTIGRIFQIPPDAPQGIINQALLKLTTNDEVVYDRYFYILFEWNDFQIRIIDSTQGGAIKNLVGMDVFRTITVALPSLSEQRAIAEALSDVDGLLNALEALIAKKRAIKQATMQQLLTGKTRLPGFSGVWETKQLGELGSFSKGRGIKRDEVSGEGVPCVRYGELYTQYKNYILKVASRIPPSVADTALPIKKGDLLFAGSGETAEEIGRCAAYLGEEQAYAGGDVIVLTPSGQNPIYLGHLMNSPIVSAQKARMGQSDAVVHIYINNLAQVQIELPPITEQRAIASILSDMDTELAALEQRRDKTRAIKQGMMQQLLTGRVRLSESRIIADDTDDAD